MAMNIKDPETERLIAELADLTGETKTGAVRTAVQTAVRHARASHDVERRRLRLQRLLEDEIWPLIPPEELGRPLSKEEREEILGFGPDGV
jgi:antitoxin VapB